jgi:hypothetical protein
MTFHKLFTRLQTPVVAAAMPLLLFVIGCGGGTSDNFKGERGSVSGKIEYTGKSIPAGSTVMFQSTTGGYTALGKTNDQGEYTLLYNGKQTLPATTYKVQINAPAAPPATVDPANMGKTAGTPAPFPAKYNSSSTSGMEFTVKPGANKADFVLID